MRCCLALALFGGVMVPGPAYGRGAAAGPQPPGPGAKREPFLGLPEESSRRIEDDNPRVDPRLRGIVTMTEVRLADHASYLEFKRAGKVSKEERRGGFVYFAVPEVLHVPFPAPPGGAAGGAYLTVTKRLKAPLPKDR